MKITECEVLLSQCMLDAVGYGFVLFLAVMALVMVVLVVVGAWKDLRRFYK